MRRALPLAPLLLATVWVVYAGVGGEASGLPIRLPSEAEWEAACRSGTRSTFAFGDDMDALGEHAWYARNSGRRPHEVGTRRANAWGLHDFHGNAWEWCRDTWHLTYRGAPRDGRAWIAGEAGGGTPDHMLRGGSFDFAAEACGSAHRAAGGGREMEFFRPGFRPAFSLRAGQEPLLAPYLNEERAPRR